MDERLCLGPRARESAIGQQLVEPDAPHASMLQAADDQAALTLDRGGDVAAGSTEPSFSRTWARMPGTSIRC
jgi:hypothetical protein